MTAAAHMAVEMSIESDALMPALLKPFERTSLAVA
jgi:hypothetical protein